MGMFDTVYLADSIKGIKVEEKSIEFQSKSLNCFLDTFEIRKGKLYRIIPITRKPTKEEMEKRQQEQDKFERENRLRGWKWVTVKLRSFWRLIKTLNPINNRVVWHNVKVEFRWLVGLNSATRWFWKVDALVITGYKKELYPYHGDLEIHGDISGAVWVEATLRFTKGKLVKVVSVEREDIINIKGGR